VQHLDALITNMSRPIRIALWLCL